MISPGSRRANFHLRFRLGEVVNHRPKQASRTEGVCVREPLVGSPAVRRGCRTARVFALRCMLRT